MTPDRSLPEPRCAACGASATLGANYCIECGQPLSARPGQRSLAPVRIVEADAMALSETPSSADTALSQPSDPPGALAMLPQLAALAWRQPAVRSAVKTGASAVALSLVWRVAGAALTGRRSARALVSSGSLAPLVGDALRGATPSKRLRRRGRRGEIVEEIVYIRRIFRR